MVMTVAGPPLTKFAGHAQPQHTIAGPGSNALQMIPGNDVTTWLVSPGVVDCAILTIVLGTTRPGGAVWWAPSGGRPSHGPGGYPRHGALQSLQRPTRPAITALFNSCLAGQTATVNDLMVAILFNAWGSPTIHQPVGDSRWPGRPCTAFPHDA